MLLELDGVGRSFGGVQAVQSATFGVAPGEVHGLIGPNGAGKTTLLNLVSGLVRPTSGAIRLRGRRLDGLSSHRIAALGVTRTFQNIRLFPELSALDNVIVGAHLTRRAPLWQRLVFAPAAGREERSARGRAHALLERVGLADRALERSANLSYGEQRRVEIARALAADPAVLLLDEPTAGMSHGEVESIAALIRDVAREGRSVLLVEHNLELVMGVCDRITVLDFGKVLADGAPGEVRADPAVIAAYLGADA
ncbi:MAG TPA: ABC transporter ATP-binding protein [Anaeromyxobacteraceae bacterium]|nr:ABC transporter ATP-binding protein [Anaeromyxobacteraceae bacterium]